EVCDLVHSVVPVGAEEFEAQLHAADVRLDLAGQCLGRVELRQVESEVDGVGHRVSLGRSSGTSVVAGVGAGSCAVSGGGGAAAVLATAVRCAVSSELIRRLSRHFEPWCSSHIGSRPSRNDTTTSAGILVSSTSPCQIVSSIGRQLNAENTSSTTSSRTQMIV